MCVLPVYMYVRHVCACCPWRSEEGIGSPRTGVSTVVNHQVGAGNQAPVLCKNNKCSQLLSHLSNPHLTHF